MFTVVLNPHVRKSAAQKKPSRSNVQPRVVFRGFFIDSSVLIEGFSVINFRFFLFFYLKYRREFLITLKAFDYRSMSQCVLVVFGAEGVKLHEEGSHPKPF